MTTTHTTPPPSSATRRLEVIDGQLEAYCLIEQPSESSVLPRKGPCWLPADHDGPCSWAVAG